MIVWQASVVMELQNLKINIALIEKLCDPIFHSYFSLLPGSTLQVSLGLGGVLLTCVRLTFAMTILLTTANITPECSMYV